MKALAKSAVIHGPDTQHAALGLTVFDQLSVPAVRHIAGDRKDDTDAAADRGQDRGIDPDLFDLEVDQRPAGVTAVDGGVGLNKVFQLS
ncbi:hypothetical protein [Edwardsiella ictaluri]|uniref:hypothetical protein n=1 Tax=Edwardsiella ictaluri TaxID=67780 RepID=UPI0036D43B57